MPDNRPRARPTDIVITPAAINATASRDSKPATPADASDVPGRARYHVNSPAMILGNVEQLSTQQLSPLVLHFPVTSYWSPDSISPLSALSSAFMRSRYITSPVSPMYVETALRSSPTIFSPTFMNPRTPPIPPSLLLPPCPSSPYFMPSAGRLQYLSMGRRHSIDSVMYGTSRDDVKLQARRFSLASAPNLQTLDEKYDKIGGKDMIETLSSMKLSEEIEEE